MSTATEEEITTVDLVFARRVDGQVVENHRVTVMAQPTKTPGLVVTPAVHGNALAGTFQVTHAPSGCVVPVEVGGIDVHTATRVADALADTPIDWTADEETLAEQLKDPDIRAAVAAAVKRGKYPPPESQWDEAGGKPVDGPAGWPNTAEQATAKQIAGVYTRAALQRYVDGRDLMRYDRRNKTAAYAHILNLHSMIAEYGVVSLLRALAAVDPDAADAAARDHWEACQAGDSFGELLYEWGREYGIPTPDKTNLEEVGIPAPPAMSYDAVLNTPLMYPEHGTIGSLRETIARNAYYGQQKLDELLATPDGGRPRPLDEDNHDAMVAHGCSFYGWALTAVLGWLAKEYPLLAIPAARMIDDIGTNGGNDFCADLPYPPAGETEEPTTTG